MLTPTLGIPGGIDLEQLLFTVKECICWPHPQPILSVVSPYGMQVLREISHEVEREQPGMPPAMPLHGFQWDRIFGVMVWVCNRFQRDEARIYYTWAKAYEDLKDLMGPKDVEYLKAMESAEREFK